MDLRFDLGARATKDLDLAARTDPGEIIGRFDEALAPGLGDFTARRTPVEDVRDGRGTAGNGR